MKEDESVLLKTYIQEWTKFFAQCQYITKPFKSLETHSAKNNSGIKKGNKPAISESSSIKKVCNERKMFRFRGSSKDHLLLIHCITTGGNLN